MFEVLENRRKNSDALLIRPCLEIMMFSELSLLEAGDDFLKAYQIIESFIGDSLNFYITNSMKRARKLTSSPEEQMECVLKDKNAMSSVFLTIEQHSGESYNDYALPSFVVLSETEEFEPRQFRNHVLFRICLAIDKDKRILEIVHKALRYFPLSSGYCGFSYYYNTVNFESDSIIEAKNRNWLKRFPGLNHGDPLDLLMIGTQGLLQVGWLTLLGEKYTQHLEPLDDWATQLPKGIQANIIPENRSLIIQAGAKPELGDRNRQESLPLYESIGKTLSGFRLPDDVIEKIGVVGLEDEDVIDWLFKFIGKEAD